MSIQTEPCLTEPSQLRQWLADLPWLNVDQATTSLLCQLKSLSRLRLPLRQRHQVLQLYQSALIPLLEDLEQRLLDTALPLCDRDQETAQRLLDLDRLMGANAIQIVFAPAFLDPHQFSPTERRTLLLHTLEWLARLALHSAQIYHPPGEDFWRTVYRIYLLLETHRLLPPIPASGTPPEIRTHLFRILLLGLCGPQRFRQQELKQIDRFLHRFAGHAEIHPHNTRHPFKAGFFFDCADPHPPRSTKLLKQIEPPPRVLRFIYPREVARQLLEYVSSSSGPLQDQILPTAQAKKLALRLAHILGAPRQRKWHRLRQQGECLLIAGLEELIAALSREEQTGGELCRLLPAPSSTEADAEFGPDFELLPLENEPVDHRGECNSEAGIFQQLLSSRHQTDACEIWTRTPAGGQSNRKIHFPGRFADVCAQGYCLIWLDHTCARLKVGEILGINHTQGEIEVGAIRWLRQHSSREITVGVELLSFTASLVVTGMWIPGISAAAPQHEWGLFFPAQPAISRPPCLLAPAFAWQRGQWVEIYHSLERKENHCLKQLIDSTPTYDLFVLEKIS